MILSTLMKGGNELWLARTENVRAVVIRGIFVQIAAIGQRVIMSSNHLSRQQANYAMNAKPNDLPEIAASHAHQHLTSLQTQTRLYLMRNIE